MVARRTWNRWALRALRAFAVAFAGLVLFAPARASAYPWMIRHGYTACAPCHSDPSGSGPLTPYGRVIGDTILSTKYGPEATAPDTSGFLFGLVHTPDWLELGGDVRGALLRTKTAGVPEQRRSILMQADLSATISVKRFIASATGGYAHEGALGAAVTRSTQDNFVSREHWLGYALGADSQLLLRAGRMNLPFGIRNVEHTLWARSLTATNIDDQQQFGVAFAWNAGILRGELLGILGNFQLRPDDYRERGYSTYVEAAVTPQLAIGVSSLLTHRSLSPTTLTETWRQAHGVHVRYATPWEPLVLLSEWDYTFVSSRDQLHRKGFAGYAQADLEAAQGVHFLVTGEANNVGVQGPPSSWGLWLSYNWFLLPHSDLRLDGIYQSLGSSSDRVSVYTLLLQAHVYL
jgi:hypothetical protein